MRSLPRDLRILVAAAPGSAPDIVARSLVEGWERHFGLTAAVMNVEGANGELALARYLREPPTGHAWLLAHDTVIAANPYFYPRARAGILDGLVPVAQVGSNPFYVLVREDDPIRSLAELVRVARSSEPAMVYGSGGIGSYHHMLMEELARLTGARWHHIPYRGNSQSSMGLVRGEVRVVMAGSSTLGLVRGGRLRMLAVTSPARQPAFPDVPAVAELVPGFQGAAWFGFFGRTGTDPSHIADMLELARASLHHEGIQAVLRDRANLAPVFSHGAPFLALIESDRQRFAAMAATMAREGPKERTP